MSSVTDVSRVRKRGRNVGRLGSVDSLRLPVLVPASTVVAAVAVGVAAYTGYLALAVTLAGLGLLLAWGWPVLVGAPGLAGVRGVLLVAALAVAVAVGGATGDQRLAALPVVAAVVMVGGFLQQLAREGTRPRLTEGLSGVASGLAVLAAGATYLPVVLRADGPDFVLVALAGLVAGVAAEQLGRHGRVRTLVVIPVLLAGGLVGWALAAPTGVSVLLSVGLASLLASFSHTTRRVLGAVPGAHQAVAQIAAGVGSVLLPGVLVLALAVVGRI